MINFKERMKITFDKKQTKFKENGLTDIEEVMINFNKIYLCPFCLYKGKYGTFLTSIRQDLVKCPECDNSILVETLVKEMTVKEFARWVYRYSFSGFWQKCNFKIFNKRLMFMGIAREFWDEYKRLKGE